MGDFDMSKDYRTAGAILFPMALVGITCNFAVITFLKSMPSLNNSFGSLTLSQAMVDCVHQTMFAFYFAPTIFTQNPLMYSISAHFGYIILTAYQICCYSHLCISINRFLAVCFPVPYKRIFSKKITRCIIVAYWVLGITHMTFMLKFGMCYFIFAAVFCIMTSFSSVFTSSLWIVHRLRYVPTSEFLDLYIQSYAVMLLCHVVRRFLAQFDFRCNSRSVGLHCMTVKHTDTLSMQRRRAQKNLVYQAALQGILFITELLTYFLVSGHAKNKWQAFGLTSVSWCLVNGADGFIVLVCNRDFRKQIKKMMGYQDMPTNWGPSTVMSVSNHNHSVTAVTSHAVTDF